MNYDLIIIGAGPAGLTAGVYARSRKLNTLILEAKEAGGQLMSLYPDKGIHNFPSSVHIQAKNLAERLIAHAESMGCEIKGEQRVREILNGDEELIVKTDSDEFHTKAVIIAIGIGLFKPRMLACDGEKELQGKGVFYRLPDKEYLVDKRVVMIGGGNSALEMALIADTVGKTTVVHRRDKFRADESVVDKVCRSGIETVMKAGTSCILGDDKVEGVTVVTEDGKERTIPCDMVVVNIGTVPDLDDLKNWGVELEEDMVKVKEDMGTSRPGIFACGDVVTYEGKYKQIVTACGEAATASNSAYKFIKKPYWA
jgi:thioredoxin reductase